MPPDFAACFFCSLLLFVFEWRTAGAEIQNPKFLPADRQAGKIQNPTGVEAQELRVALEALRKENAALRQADKARQRELALATNKLAQLETRVAGQRRGLAADDDEARSAEEWRAFLLQALKTLDDAESEIRSLGERLRLLHDASRDALKAAEKVDPSKRSLLEMELRRSEKLFNKEERRAAVFLDANESGSLKAVKVIGVNLDLGVTALAVGRKQGARVGMPFLVSRGKVVVAALTLAEVRENASLALIERMETDQPIREGDTAMLRKM